ncbi:rho guanine nucleotide exchange factor 15-like isoform X2 [Carcharodon carcharias]|nr:rho guanine nucleotide exchange factor 15-like isoform X2 [Carcharodon carcharias]
MASMANGPPEMEVQKRAGKQQPRPPLKPKPPVPGHGARKQDGTRASAGLEPSAEADVLRSSDGAQSTGPPVPTRRRASGAAPEGGEALSSSGNVRKMRELFQQALSLPEGEKAAAKDKSARGLQQSEVARVPPARAMPVPKARLKRMARVAVPPHPLVNDSSGQVPPVAKVRPSVSPPSRGAAKGPKPEETRDQGDPAGDGEAERRCSPTCPCVCHTTRPGMVLVWRPASVAQEGVDQLDNSLSDSSESGGGAKPFRYVMRVTEGGREDTSEEEEDHHQHVRCSGRPGWTVPEISLTGTEAAGEREGDGGQPPGSASASVSTATVTEGGAGPALPEPGGPPGASAGKGLDRAHGAPLPGGTARPAAANQLPKPPRRNKPARQSSLAGKGAPLPHRRLAQVRRSDLDPPSRIRQRYTASDLDKISQCVDGLNLHFRKLGPPPSLPPEALKPLSPKVTRSAPPSPKEKHLQAIYDEIGTGVDDDSGDDYEAYLEILESRPAKTGNQKMTNWESQFQSEPLYQTYRETVINKAIKQQTLIRDSSKTSEDYVYESIPFVPDSDRAPLQDPRSQSPGNSLWQNLSAVRQSGILDELSQGECRLQESMFEVLTSEASYLRSLNVLTEHFMDSKDLNETIILRDKKTLFSCITRVKEVSESFLKDLEDRMDESIKIKDVCDIIYLHALHNFQVYVDYVRNQLYQEQKYSQLMEENAQFAAVVVRLQELPRCQRLPFMSFLLLPFQRITRIKMLLENILQRSEVGSVNEETASKALGLVSKIIEECNREVGIMKQMEEMIHIGKKLEFDKLKAIPIISQLRHLEKQGELSEIVFRGNLFGMKPKVTPLYLFLFNDLLLITNKRSCDAVPSGDRYQVVDYAHRSLVEVQECANNSMGAGIGNVFMLILLENHQGKQSERLVKTSTESDRHRWMDALMSGKENLPEDSNDDKIYERWDCPQMQCLIPYTAQQADELSLEPADIINITRKSAEGWFEGCKLSTGQKGWFPSDNVQEITNEHVRRRNLRERYRLLQAAQHQTRPSETTSKANVSF